MAGERSVPRSKTVPEIELITHDEVCRIFGRSKAQIRRYRKEGLGDYGGRPLMFDRAEVQEFIRKRRKVPDPDKFSAKGELSAFQRGRLIYRKMARAKDLKAKK